jgi:hypothetical protein
MEHFTKDEYKDFFCKLLDKEMKKEKSIKKVHVVKDVRIQYTMPKIECIIKVEDTKELFVGDKLVIKNNSRNTEARVSITEITEDEVHLDVTDDLYQRLRNLRRKQSYTVQQRAGPDELRNIIEDNQEDLKWEKEIGGFYFHMRPNELGHILRPGTILNLKDQTHDSEIIVMVDRYLKMHEKVYLFHSISQTDQLYEVSLHCNTIVYNRMFEAIFKLSGRTDFFFTNIILGNQRIVNQVANPDLQLEDQDRGPLVLPPRCPPLRESELTAVRKSLSSDFLLIQGPRMTRKMVVTTVIILNLFERFGKVLVAAPSNRSANQLASRLLNTNLRITRLHSNLRQKIGAIEIRRIAFHTQIKQLMNTIAQDNPDKKPNMRSLRQAATTRLLKETDVMICTCAGGSDPRISKFSIDSVVIYESTRGKEPECLMPILKGKKKIIMIGDRREKAFCVSNEAEEGGLSVSLFERLVRNGNVPHILS